jgi:two-component system sensor histidine kinase/response regulator
MNKDKIRVLYIDDEVNNLHAFKALFRKDYDIFIAESADEGTKLLAEQQVHVIICDQRMPGMTGVEFFESILEKYPHPIRILLTGYTDIQAVVEAINRGQIYRFIDKPWDQQVLSVAIQNAYEIYHTKFLLREQNIQLQKAYEELDKFVYSASHDLRAPLASILGIIKVAKSEDVSKMPEYVDMIDHTVNRMDAFVQNIIKYYRSNRLDVEINHINFENIVNEILFEIDSHLKGTHIQFLKNINEPVYIRSDESRIRIILNNILLNAIKFHDENNSQKSINIRVVTNLDGSIIEIEDNGIGIAPEHQDKVFDMFFRGVHKNSGSGVGLYVAKEALKRINGSIQLESTPGVGSKFIVQIPNLLK